MVRHADVRRSRRRASPRRARGVGAAAPAPGHERPARGARVDLATFDAGRQELLCYATTQNPQLVRLTLARLLHLPVHSVRVVNTDIGGSFGQKAWVRHEDVAVAAAARGARSAREVDREPDREHRGRGDRPATSTPTSRSRSTPTARSAACGSALVLDQGAYPIASNVRTGTTTLIRTLLPSAYRIEHFAFSATIVASNKASYTTYRGPWAAETWLRERMLDLVAHDLGIDPVAFRHHNLWDDRRAPRPMVTGPTLSALTVKSSLARLEEHPTYRACERRFHRERRQRRAGDHRARKRKCGSRGCDAGTQPGRSRGRTRPESSIRDHVSAARPGTWCTTPCSTRYVAENAKCSMHGRGGVSARWRNVVTTIG